MKPKKKVYVVIVCGKNANTSSECEKILCVYSSRDKASKLCQSLQLILDEYHSRPFENRWRGMILTYGLERFFFDSWCEDGQERSCFDYWYKEMTSVRIATVDYYK